jgi:hypothetical protein
LLLAFNFRMFRLISRSEFDCSRDACRLNVRLFFDVKEETIYASEISVNVHQTIQRHIPEARTLLSAFVQRWSFRLVFGRCLVQVPATTQALLTENFPGSIQANITSPVILPFHATWSKMQWGPLKKPFPQSLPMASASLGRENPNSQLLCEYHLSGTKLQ